MTEFLTVQMRRDAERIARETLEILGYENLRVRIEWKNRFTARMGDARYNVAGSRVRFSIPLWPRASEEERRHTVIHEICHIVANHEAKGRRIKAHGIEWRNLMRRCGEKPERCHNVDRTGLAGNRRTIVAMCACGEHPITPYKAEKIRSGTKYKCLKCRVYLSVGSEPVSQSAQPKRRTVRGLLEDLK